MNITDEMLKAAGCSFGYNMVYNLQRQCWAAFDLEGNVVARWMGSLWLENAPNRGCKWRFRVKARSIP